MTKYVPHPPHPKQAAFLLLPQREALYGGAAGGGKSDALLMAALQYVDVPGYAAILFRRTYADLALPGALMDRAKEWLAPWQRQGEVRWSDKEKTWHFPSGATVSFGYLEHGDDRYRYQSSEFQYIGFDELTQFPELVYRYLFSRLRKPAAGPVAAVPLRMRAGSNPGGIGHEWVKRRFITARQPGRIFMPAKLADNTALDAAAYVQSLNELDPVTRAQLLNGDWDAFEGGRFHKHWFRTWDYGPDGHYRLKKPEGLVSEHREFAPRFTIVDPAAEAKETADYTAIGTFAVGRDKDLIMLDMVRRRLPLDELPREVLRVCRQFGSLFVGIEAVGAFWGAALVMQKLAGMPPVRRLSPWVGKNPPGQKMKLTRATPAIVLAEAGQVYLPERAAWVEDFVAECVQFTGDPDQDAHDDQVDVLAYAVAERQRLGGGGQPVPAAGQEESGHQARLQPGGTYRDNLRPGRSRLRTH